MIARDNSNDSIPSCDLSVRFEGEFDVRRSIVAKKVGAAGKSGRWKRYIRRVEGSHSRHALDRVHGHIFPWKRLSRSRSKRASFPALLLDKVERIGRIVIRSSSGFMYLLAHNRRRASSNNKIRSKKRFPPDDFPRIKFSTKKNESKIDPSLESLLLAFHA